MTLVTYVRVPRVTHAAFRVPACVVFPTSNDAHMSDQLQPGTRRADPVIGSLRSFCGWQLGRLQKKAEADAGHACGMTLNCTEALQKAGGSLRAMPDQLYMCSR